jgi:hypothetical protein
MAPVQERFLWPFSYMARIEGGLDEVRTVVLRGPLG